MVLVWRLEKRVRGLGGQLTSERRGSGQFAAPFFGQASNSKPVMSGGVYVVPGFRFLPLLGNLVLLCVPYFPHFCSGRGAGCSERNAFGSGEVQNKNSMGDWWQRMKSTVSNATC